MITSCPDSFCASAQQHSLDHAHLFVHLVAKHAEIKALGRNTLDSERFRRVGHGSSYKCMQTYRHYLLVDLVAKHAELKALELHHQHCRGRLHGHAFGCPYFALLLGADVLVGAIQVLCASEALQGALQVTCPVDLQAQVQKGVIGVGLMPTLCALHLQHPHDTRLLALQMLVMYSC